MSPLCAGEVIFCRHFSGHLENMEWWSNARSTDAWYLNPKFYVHMPKIKSPNPNRIIKWLKWMKSLAFCRKNHGVPLIPHIFLDLSAQLPRTFGICLKKPLLGVRSPWWNTLDHLNCCSIKLHSFWSLILTRFHKYCLPD